MRAEIYPLQVLLLTVSGWVHRHQAGVIELTLAGPADLQIHFNGLQAGVESPGTHTLRRVR